MTIELDHFIVPCRDKAASARQLGELLGVPWVAESGVGPFAAVYVNDGCTLDFIETAKDFPVHHFCFRVAQAEFDAILARIQAADIVYGGDVRDPTDWWNTFPPRQRAIAWTGSIGHSGNRH